MHVSIEHYGQFAALLSLPDWSCVCVCVCVCVYVFPQLIMNTTGPISLIFSVYDSSQGLLMVSVTPNFWKHIIDCCVSYCVHLCTRHSTVTSLFSSPDTTTGSIKIWLSFKLCVFLHIQQVAHTVRFTQRNYWEETLKAKCRFLFRFGSLSFIIIVLSFSLLQWFPGFVARTRFMHTCIGSKLLKAASKEMILKSGWDLSHLYPKVSMPMPFPTLQYFSMSPEFKFIQTFSQSSQRKQKLCF